MTWLWILGVIVLLLFLLLFTRVGVLARICDGALTLDIRFGFFRFHAFPAKKKKKPKKQPKKNAVATKPKEKGKLKISFADIQDAVKTLWPPLKRALNRTRRGIRIHPLTLSLTLGAANDPAAEAELYGYLHAGIWTVMPVLEKLLVIPEPSIHIGIDFDTPSARVEGTIGLSARIGTLLGVALTVAIPALRWFLRWRKKLKKTSAPQTAAETKTAA